MAQEDWLGHANQFQMKMNVGKAWTYGPIFESFPLSGKLLTLRTYRFAGRTLRSNNWVIPVLPIRQKTQYTNPLMFALPQSWVRCA